MAVGGQGAPPVGAGAPSPPRAAASMLGAADPGGVFGPSSRPDQSMLAGLPGHGGVEPMLEPDVDMVLRRMVDVSGGHPDLVRLLERRGGA